MLNVEIEGASHTVASLLQVTVLLIVKLRIKSQFHQPTITISPF
jgi:hypothetical protein